MFKIFIARNHRNNQGNRKYVKCSNCKLFDSIYSNTIPNCDICHQPLKEISEEEYKQKLENMRRYKEETRTHLQTYHEDKQYQSEVLHEGQNGRGCRKSDMASQDAGKQYKCYTQ